MQQKIQIQKVDNGRRQALKSIFSLGALAFSTKFLCSCTQNPISAKEPTKQEILSGYNYLFTQKIPLGQSIDFDNLQLQLEGMRISNKVQIHAYINIATKSKYLKNIEVLETVPTEINLNEDGQYAFSLNHMALRDHIKDCYAVFDIYSK
jgi:hypothetical protein